MPRKQRFEYPGAIYHIISRGNYRKDLFTHENTAKAFERTIFEATEHGRNFAERSRQESKHREVLAKGDDSEEPMDRAAVAHGAPELCQ